jgi:hypothetical protein
LVVPEVFPLPLDDGEIVLVEVRDADGSAPERVGRTGPAIHATETLQDALRRTRPALQAVVTQMRGLDEPPDRVTLKFGITLTAAAGVVIAHASSEANFEVRVEWNRQRPT